MDTGEEVAEARLYSPSSFIHLRVHSAYSLLEGAVRVKDLPRLCLAQDMPAVAVTDTGNLFGALEIAETLVKEGVQPITGCALAVRFDDAEGGQAANGAAHAAEIARVVLLVQDAAGYANLMKLSSRAFLESDGHDIAHVTLDLLQRHSGGLICLTGGAEGPVGRLLQAGRHDAAENLLRKFRAMFPDRLYVELQRHGLEAEIATEDHFVSLAYRNDLPLIATNDVYFPEREMYDAHDALICIAEGAYISQDDRRRLTAEHYFKSADEMSALFADLPEAIENTLEVAQRCAFRPQTRPPILPSYGNAQTAEQEAEELRRQAREGLRNRLRDEGMYAAEEDYYARLDYELGVISEMGFSGYFLIVADFIKWAKQRDIPVGPGRGSGAGSCVAWSLTITDLDPLRFGLLFERFLNPERVSMPDFDVDFCQDRRDEVIRYVQEKYGFDHVAQIIAVGKLQARAA
ncbi:MAG TPA: DNA polymerase III subunit alpha, partial [Alphaproteobacteria bacterium]|nr:DNA polymerase III subunit alpha [Alphaproteobacteria bacterium]HBA42904.1 DNA polymerase III subunit alpha [Alphaproteobacteria bacterium]